MPAARVCLACVLGLLVLSWAGVTAAQVISPEEREPVEVAAAAPAPIEKELTIQPQIIGGIVTNARPAIGQFLRRGSACTATLITPRHVITAAHCLNEDDYQDTAVSPGDRFVVAGASPFAINRYYSFGSHLTEKIWNGYSSDLALIRLASPVPSSIARPVAIADARPRWPSDWSTRFGYGCTARGDNPPGAGVKRYFSYQGLNSNVLCPGDSGGPTMRGQGVDAAPLWSINSGYSWNLFRGGHHDIEADATYHKKQIEAVIHAWEGDDKETDIDRYGADYASDSTVSSADDCRSACIDDSGRCRAWTFFVGTCYLKDAVPNWTPRPGAISGLNPDRPRRAVSDRDYDRWGSDFHSFHFFGADEVCTQACARDYRCQAYAITDLASGGARRCYLKDSAPSPYRRVGVSSGVKRGLELNTDRFGSDYHVFSYAMPSPEICQSQCASDSRCRAWSYIGPANGRAPTCYLKNAVPTAAPRTGVISGRKGWEFF